MVSEDKKLTTWRTIFIDPIVKAKDAAASGKNSSNAMMMTMGKILIKTDDDEEKDKDMAPLWRLQ